MATGPMLIMAMSKMKGGICTAGFATESDPVTGLRWVRPLRRYDTLLAEDMCMPRPFSSDGGGGLARCFDVLDVSLVRPCPEPPHVEDWVADFVRHRPRLLRRVEGERRAEFLAAHLDRAPEQVLIDNTRSLCLVQPELVWATFRLDGYSGKYEARLGFRLPGTANHRRAQSERGVSATNVRWRALGRMWLGQSGGSLQLDQGELMARLDARSLYLTVGLSRLYQGEYWPLVVGVHAVPDFGVEVNPDNL
ncbi:MAG: dual OB domain-containing protein [Anaerolineae bacterium]